jgi:hypothetical protein
MTRIVSLLIAGLCLPLCVGCAHYEYDLVSPPQVAQHIGTQANANITLGPLHYVLRADENYLVMRIYNETDAPVRLLGDRSFVVDQNSQSRPLQSQAIGPHSFIKLIFPPPPAQVVYPYGPTIGYGFGYDYGWGYGYYDPFWFGAYNYAPSYAVYSNGDPGWDWTGDTEVSLTLTFQQGEEKPFSEPFVFRQKTMR